VGSMEKQLTVIGVSITYSHKPQEHFGIKYAAIRQPDKLLEVGKTTAADQHDVIRFFDAMSKKFNSCPIVVEMQSALAHLIYHVWRNSTNVSYVNITKKEQEKCLHAVLHDFSAYSLQLDSDHIIALGLALLHQPPLWRNLQF